MESDSFSWCLYGFFAITKVQLMKAAEIFKDKAKGTEQMLYAIYGRVDGGDMRIHTQRETNGD